MFTRDDSLGFIFDSEDEQSTWYDAMRALQNDIGISSKYGTYSTLSTVRHRWAGGTVHMYMYVVRALCIRDGASYWACAYVQFYSIMLYVAIYIVYVAIIAGCVTTLLLRLIMKKMASLSLACAIIVHSYCRICGVQ